MNRDRAASRVAASPGPDNLAAGARVQIRDAEWLLRRVDRTSHGSQAVTCVGLSELVKDREAMFLTDLHEIDVLRPEDTRLVVDSSRLYIQSLVYLESLLRQSPPTDEKLYLGHRGAMEVRLLCMAYCTISIMVRYSRS